VEVNRKDRKYVDIRRFYIHFLSQKSMQRANHESMLIKKLIKNIDNRFKKKCVI
jgi:hypothetical protein